MLYILISSQPPFNAPNDAEIMKKVKKNAWNYNDPFWATVSEECKTFISAMMNSDPEKRLSAEQALQNPWLQSKVDKEAVFK